MTHTPSNLPSDLTQRVRDRLGKVLTPGKRDQDQLEMHEAIELGFPIHPPKNQNWLPVFLKRFAPLKDGSKRTAEGKSRRSRQRLDSYLSGRIYQFAVLFEEALDVLGSEEAVIEFLEKPAIALNRYKPIDLISTPPGLKLVKMHIERMRYGVYS